MQYLDSHTEGEPTRLIFEGFPALEGRTMGERRAAFRQSYDHLRQMAVLEPRGYDAVVGALLTDPADTDAHAGVIFFNDVGYLGMCGHGTIGLAHSLRYLRGELPNPFRLATPVGVVEVVSHEDGSFEIQNVPAYVGALDVQVGDYRGDIAYGGNWFYIAPAKTPLKHENLDELLAESYALRDELRRQGVTGRDGAEIDHIELFAGHDVFVLCPGKAWDRSPCGTGTSAKMAVLQARRELAEGETWVQRSLVGGEFQGRYQMRDGHLIPFVRGRAWVTARGTLLQEPGDILASR